MSTLDSNKFDELFRNSFEHGELPVSDKLLSNIKADLGIQEQGKGKKSWWIWFLVGLGCVSIITMTIFFKNYNDAAEKSKKKAEITNKNSVVNNNEKRGKRSDPEKPVVPQVNTVYGIDSTPMTVEKFVDVQSENDSMPITRTKAANSSKSVETISKQQSIKPNNITPQKDEIVSKNKIKNSNNSTKSSLSGKEITTEVVKNSKDAKKLLENQNSLEKSKENNATKSGSEKNNVIDNSQSPINTSGKQKGAVNDFNSVSVENEKSLKTQQDSIEKNKGIQVSSDELNEKNALFSDSSNIINDSLNTLKQTGKFDTLIRKNDTLATSQTPGPSKKITYFIDVNAGLSQSFRTLKTETGYSFENRDKETPWLTYNGGIDVGVLYKNKLQFSIGAGVDNKGEKYIFGGKNEISHTEEQSVMIIDSVSYVDTLTSDTLYFYDTIYVVDTVKIIEQPAVDAKSIVNKYQYVKLPIMFGYRFVITDKLFVTPSAGIIVNVLSSATATWFDGEQQKYIVYDTRDKYNTLVWVARVKIDIGYNLNSKWSILLQPGYTRYLNSIYRKEQNFKQYPFSYDCNLGVRYSF